MGQPAYFIEISHTDAVDPVSRNRAAATCTMRSWISSLSALNGHPTPSILVLDREIIFVILILVDDDS